MATYNVGDYIYDVRKKHGITQEELAFGICSAGTLSRIENGSQAPSMRTYHALMERLGESPQLFSVFAGREEIEIYKMNRKILRQLAGNQFECAEKLLQEYTEKIEEPNSLTLQFSLAAKAICHAGRKKEPVQICEELQQALHITVQGKLLDGAGRKKRLLTREELLLWNNLAIQYKRMGEAKAAMQILSELQEYMDLRIGDEEEKAGLYPVITCNIAKWMNEMKQYQEAVQNCEKAIALCLECGKLLPLPYLFYQKAIGLENLGAHLDAGEAFQKAENLIEIMRFEREILEEEMMAAM